MSSEDAAGNALLPPLDEGFCSTLEGFHSRQNLCRNAILVNLIGPNKLGHYPKEMMANGFTTRFGCFSNDFHIARCQERNFVFLPQWVQANELLS